MKDEKRANQRLSRRDFVKGTTVGAGAAMATGLGTVAGRAEEVGISSISNKGHRGM